MPPKFSYEDGSAFLYIAPTMTLRRPPCQAVCPAGVPVSLMNRLLAREKPAEALAVLLDITPFPEWLCEPCGRPCEKACNKGRHTSSPVPIARLESQAASCLPDAHPPRAAQSGRKAAVAGNGPAELAAAYFLSRLGHDVTVMGREEDVKAVCAQSFDARKALGRVRGYLVGHGAAFSDCIPDAARLNAEFDAVVACSAVAGVNPRQMFPIATKSASPAAWAGSARLAACMADTALAGYTPERLASLRILPDGEIEREILPLDMPEDAKPVTTVHYEALNNTAYFAEHLSFRERLSPGESLTEQAMECFHCGKCIGCGTCVTVCPGDVLDMREGRPYVRYPAECIHCSACMLDCPSSAIFFRLPLPATLGAPMTYLA